ncbi:MAG: SdpI family protein [Actinomycetia bacterium]|nr:SdpI family protein [Actinomycetes bacterium]
MRTIARRAATGRLDRNGLAGIRTQATLASDQAWEVGHKAGWAPVRRGAFVLITTGIRSIMLAPVLALLGAWATTRYLTLWTVVLSIGMIIALTLIIIGANLANQAARAVTAHSTG